jgi:CDP-paratose synthetase
MRILLTGATGFLGSHLARHLVQTGHQVLAWHRDSSSFQRVDDLRKRIRWYNLQQDPLERPFLENEAVDAIVHAATEYGRAGEPSSQLLQSNVAFPLRLLELGTAHQVKTFLNTDTFFNTKDCAYENLQAYSLSKHQLGEWLKRNNSTVQIVNLRLYHLYGPNDNQRKFIPRLIEDCRNNVPEIGLTLGEQRRDFIYVQDVVSAYQHFLSPQHRPDIKYWSVDIGTGCTASIRELSEMVHHQTQSRSKLCFGQLPYAPHEIMLAQANVTQAEAWGWKARVPWREGLQLTVQQADSDKSA